MTSESTTPHEAYVWVWLPGETDPVVAGLITQDADRLMFNYGRSYLERDNAISLYEPELPLVQGLLEPLPGLEMASCLRDASPDAWGRRVILNKLFGKGGRDDQKIGELQFLINSGSDRIGALDYQASPTEYVPRQMQSASLEELLTVAERVEKGLPIAPELDQAFNHGTSLGGARPKAPIEEKGVKYIAKFSSSTDTYSVVKAEFIAMRLASLCGLSVAPVSMVKSGNKDVLLVERFDRDYTPGGWTRRLMVSALTMFELNEMMARYASYQELADLIRHRFTTPRESLHELFGRIVFNILCGNTDDHARNHAAFWDGRQLTLTPAYDICPQGRTGGEASQAMRINGPSQLSQISNCLTVAEHFQLTPSEAIAKVMHQILVIGQQWQAVCDEAELSEVDRNLFRGRQFLNPFAFEDLEGELSEIRRLADLAREGLSGETNP
ncbi:type II toxin-antitoxin system HipA family toxin [Marinobacterium litorale]|uniref:type II toxin-antitoxin system HipA family toxin n=1 Tax=Marinobacterium litorale TaxID=404770 RepID=UPI0003F6E353|nr:type II toxin-antitoxin system HipA family toxin [Marinobacterium litorale]